MINLPSKLKLKDLTQWIVMLVCLMISPLTWSQIYYVNVQNQSGPWDGKSWKTAWRSLTDALKMVSNGNEIWVSKGVYFPTDRNDPYASFHLKKDVALYGGFQGNESKKEERNWKKNKTELSGYVSNPSNEFRVYHVLIGANHATLDGFTIRSGLAVGSGRDKMGGGILDWGQSSPIIRHCLFENNEAILGGAMMNYYESSPIIEDSIFRFNRAVNGGAVINRDHSSPQFTRTAFLDNDAALRGGAVLNDFGASPQFNGCQFIRNRTSGNGGAVYTDGNTMQPGGTTPQFDHCDFTQNRAKWLGGAIDSYAQSVIHARDASFLLNQAGQFGGAIANEDGAKTYTSNCAFNGNQAVEAYPIIYTEDINGMTQKRIARSFRY